ncbi:fork head domain-domain-containing protein [Absidia repens]|uniref:Fork head domain-domain-containing protein n=1 Tax=Absidia repens TaxID=90262 RepID=A0A1X2IM82_9FUNG|nr:fork head domain-domain-containing protein [Absidia repens]
MTHLGNGIDQTKFYTTGRIPTFTFVVEGPDASTKKTNESLPQLGKVESTPEGINTSNIYRQQPQQQKEHCDTTARTVPSGALHIVPSWQPLDANDKPPYSYATLIGHAILSSDHRKLTLSDIYQWITQHYPFYSMTEHGWQNSIRHNLSLNKAFVRIQRSSKANSGKGSFWTIRAGQELVFIDNLIKRRGPIRKQPVNLPRTLQHRRSSHRLDVTSDHDSSTYTSSASRHTNNSHLFTTFRMTPTPPASSASAPAPSLSLSTPSSSSTTPNNRSTNRKRSMPELSQRQRRSSSNLAAEDGHESDCDSGVDFGHAYPKKFSNYNNNINNYRSQLKKAKSTPCLYDDHLYNNDAARMDYTFQNLLSTTTSSSTSSFSTTTDDLSNWADSTATTMDTVTPPLFEWDPLFPTTAAATAAVAAMNLTSASPSCMDMSYQHLLASTNTDPTFSMLESPSPLGHQPLAPPLAPTPTSANGFLCHDYMLDDQLLMTSWPV